MLSAPMNTLVLATAVAAAVMGGALFAFSTFVMPALRALPPADGAAAMQEINRKAITPLFMLDLFVPAIASVVIAWIAIGDWGTPGSGYLLAGAAAYLVGVVVMTVVFNVPLNNALDGVDPNTPAGAKVWAKYLRQWTLGNHVRTITGIASAALLIIATRIG